MLRCPCYVPDGWGWPCVTGRAALIAAVAGASGAPDAVTFTVAVRRPLRVLAVEDDPSLRNFYGRFLADEGYDVRLASNGLEGLQELGWDPDLILLDLVMPVLDGYEFLRRLRASPETTHIPVLVLSGAIVKEQDRATLDAQAVLEKPFDFARLLTAVETFARGAPGAARN